MADETLICMVEIPMGSRNKYEYDPALKAIKFDRFVSASVIYPTDYGFIPDTLGEDGDELDVLVCVSEPTFPGCARTSIPSVTQSPLAGPTARRRCARSTRPASVTASGGTS